jgi:hypothetical protein
MNWKAVLRMLALKAPANPLSPLMTISSTRFSWRVLQRADGADLPVDLVEDIDAADQRFQHAGDHPGVGPGRERPLLRAAELGRRDHLHGLGDLPRVFHAADATP